jgi:hypothetical protein
MTSALEGGEWSTSGPGRLYPRDRPGTHCTGGWLGHRTGLDRCGKSRPTGIRSPDLPARSEPLYRLSYPGSSHVLKDRIKWKVSDFPSGNPNPYHVHGRWKEFKISKKIVKKLCQVEVCCHAKSLRVNREICINIFTTRKISGKMK